MPTPNPKIDINQRLVSETPGLPLYVTIDCKIGSEILQGFVSGVSMQTEYFVRFSALPEDLRERIKTFIESSLRP